MTRVNQLRLIQTEINLPAQKFRPFRVTLADGRTLNIRRADQVKVDRAGRRMTVRTEAGTISAGEREVQGVLFR